MAGTKMIKAKIIYLGRRYSRLRQVSLQNPHSHFEVIHFEKHGIEMGFTSAKEYEKAAAAVVSDSRALHKLEKEDGDDVYYLKDTNEFVIVSTDGYIRTYFYPRDGIEYFERQ